MTILGNLAIAKRRGTKYNIDRQEYLLRAREFALRGKQLPHAKLSDDDIRTIRARFKPYDRVDGAASIARDYGVHPNTINRITSYEIYYHVR